MAIKQFVDQFHSLSGKTIGEKLKNLNQLTNDVKSGCSQHEIDQFIVEVKPNNNFEKLLKGRLINSFKKSQEVLDVLRCEDRLFIKQVLGCDWFFEGSSADFPTCEFFIADVFPNTSFNTRNDIIHLLSVHLRDDRTAEQFFVAVKGEYGLKQAKPLLCACSAPFIQSVLDTDGDRVNFTEREIYKLFKKYPDLVVINLKKYFFPHSSKILELLLDVYVTRFIELFEITDCHVDLKIGRRGSKKIIRCNPAAVIKSAKKYLAVLELKYLNKYLTADDFTQFYIALFPKSYKDSYFFEDHGDFYRVVDVLPPKKRVEMLLSCFEKVYGENLLSHIDLVREKLLLLLPPDKRDVCAQQKIDKCINQDEDETYWICYLTTEKSVSMLKKLLVEAPDLDARCQLISYLFLTCKINEDLEALASVCKHVVSRYRNDNISLRAKILSELNDTFDLSKFDDRHWSSILELIKIIFLNEEYDNRGWLLSIFLARSIHYKLNNRTDICEQIDQLIVIKSTPYYCDGDWIVLKEEPKSQQAIFEAFGERIPEVKKIKPPLTKIAVSLLNSVSNWNKENKLFKSSLCKYSWAVESLRKVVDTDLDRNKNDVIELLKYDLELKQLVCPDHVYKEEVKKDVKYFLKMDTEKFIQNAQEELKFLLDGNAKKYKHLFRTWNLRSFTQVKEVVVRICSQIVEDDEETHKQENAIFLLSFLMDAKSFACLIKPFHPATEKIDPADKNFDKMLPLINASAACLKNVNPWDDYSCVKQFCKGDFLKYVLGSLMSVCYNSVQKKVMPFLEGLTNSPVSVKKHAVRLSFIIVSRPQLLPLLTHLWNADSNPATREVLLTLVWRAFSEPAPDTFALLKYCLKSLRVDDKNMFDKLSEDSHIPNDYKAEYVELCWDKLHALLQQGAKAKPYISNLLSRFMHVVDFLPSSFCDRVIKQCLCEGSPFKEVCVQFAVTYVLKSQSPSVLNERFNLISKLLQDFIRVGASGRNDVALFIAKLCTDVLLCKYTVVPQILQKFLGIWPSLFSPVDKFETFLSLKFTSLYFSCVPEFCLVSFGKICSNYVPSIMDEFGPETIILVSENLERFVASLETWHREGSGENEKRLNVITGLLTEPVHKHAYIMAAYLVPANFADLMYVKDRYIDIILTLFRVENITVRLILNSLPAFDNNVTLLDNAMQMGDQ